MEKEDETWFTTYQNSTDLIECSISEPMTHKFQDGIWLFS